MKGNVEDRWADRVITVVFVALIIDLLGFTLILPLLPSLLDHYGSVEQGGLHQMLQEGVDWFADAVGIPEHERHNSVLFGGLIGSLFSLLQFVSSPLFGAASDRYGRRSMMLLSMVGILTSYGIWAVSHSFGLFLVSRALGGASKANISLSTAIIADLPLHKRSKGMAFVGAAFSIGFMFGPPLGAALAGTGSHGALFFMPALLAAAFAASDIVFLALLLPETLPPARRVPSVLSGIKGSSHLFNPIALFRFSAVQEISREAPHKDVVSLRRLGIIYFLYIFLYSGLEYNLGFLTHTRFNFTRMQQGKMLFAVGVAMVIIQGGYVRRLPPGREMAVVQRALLLLIPAFILIGWASTLPVLYVGLLLYAFASATVVPCLTTAVASYGSPSQKGVLMGILRSLGSLARALGPVLAASAFWGTGARVCFTTGAFLFLLPVLLLRGLHSSAKKSN